MAMVVEESVMEWDRMSQQEKYAVVTKIASGKGGMTATTSAFKMMAIDVLGFRDHPKKDILWQTATNYWSTGGLAGLWRILNDFAKLVE